MNLFSMKYSSLIILFCIAACSLEDPGPDDPRVQQAVQEKIQGKISETKDDCKNETIRLAEQAVDSTMRAMALAEKLSIYNPPDKPFKPDRPLVPAIEDTSDIAPFKKNLPDGLDSIKRTDTLRIED